MISQTLINKKSIRQLYAHKCDIVGEMSKFHKHIPHKFT